MTTNIKNEYTKIGTACTEIEKEIIKIFKEKGIDHLITDNKECDPIDTYLYDENGNLVEQQVKIIVVENDKVYLYVDYPFVLIDENAYTQIDDDEYDPLFGGDLLGWFTAINIAEFIEEYL